MMKETYERLAMNVTEFDAEDIITSSVPGGQTPPAFVPGDNELPVGL